MNGDSLYGECFFCHETLHEEKRKWLFSFEFDAFFHMDCFLERLLLGNKEAVIIAREYDLKVEDVNESKRFD